MLVIVLRQRDHLLFVLVMRFQPLLLVLVLLRQRTPQLLVLVLQIHQLLALHLISLRIHQKLLPELVSQSNLTLQVLPVLMVQTSRIYCHYCCL
jgi:hypothetical protein